MANVLAHRLAIDIGVAENRVGKAVLAAVIADIPLGSLLTDLLWLQGTERGMFSQGQAFTVHMAIQVVAPRGKDELLYRGADTAIQNIKQAAHLNIGIQ